MNLRLMTAFCMTISSVMIISSDASAGYRSCQGIPGGGSSTCVDDKGFRYKCVAYGSNSVCTGKNYRKECFNDGNTGICNDSNGVKTVCKHSGLTSVCENSKGVRLVCSRDGIVSTCRW
jgi:hypothetical protein